MIKSFGVCCFPASRVLHKKRWRVIMTCLQAFFPAFFGVSVGIYFAITIVRIIWESRHE